MDISASVTVCLEDYRPPPFLVDSVDLYFDLTDDVALVIARLAVRINPARTDGVTALVLDGEQIELRGLKIDGIELKADTYHVTATTLTILEVPTSFVLEVVTAFNPADNLELEGLYRSGGLFCTQCEAEGFRKITYFLDRPDVMARYTTTIEADAARYPVLLANGNLICSVALPNGRHSVRWEDPFPKPCYLFALVAGPLVVINDSFTTKSGRVVALQLFVEPGNEDKCEHALRSLKLAMAWDELVYGLEYDLDIYMIVAVGDFNMGAMENKGLNIFNTKYVLARADTATDSDFTGIESVVAHEYFHNWTGNRVTCRDWFQLSLKEGLTVFRDQQFSADMNSHAVKRIADVQRLRSAQFQEDASALAHPVRPDSYIAINNFYTATVYDKGAELVRMIHTILGPDAFRKGMDMYFARHDGQAVTCDDFLAAMAAAGGCDLDQFKLWYSQAGTPELDVSGQYDAERGCYRLTVLQSCRPTPGQSVKSPLHIPLTIGLLGPDGHDIVLRLNGEEVAGCGSRVLMIREPAQTFEFINVAHPPVPSLLRGFSAPVRLKTSLGDDELAFLLCHDSDRFNRWEAGQTLAMRLMLRLVSDYQARRSLHLDPVFIAAFGRQLADAGQDRAFAAKTLLLPGECLLAQEMDEVDVDAIHHVREFVRQRLAWTLRDDWSSVYAACADDRVFSVDAASIGRRALKSICLSYLMALNCHSSLATAAAQYRDATTMTDSIAALGLLADSESAEAEAALADFHHRWQHEPLVINKWLAIQSGSMRPDTLERVMALLAHPSYDRRNPNKVYALIGSFGGANPVRFHAINGGGYAFLADRIIELDAMNAQVAARLAAPFSRWRRFDPARQALMLRELRRLSTTPGLSRNVGEIVVKSLALS